jgi:hypothetical protein
MQVISKFLPHSAEPIHEAVSEGNMEPTVDVVVPEASCPSELRRLERRRQLEYQLTQERQNLELQQVRQYLRHEQCNLDMLLRLERERLEEFWGYARRLQQVEGWQPERIEQLSSERERFHAFHELEYRKLRKEQENELACVNTLNPALVVLPWPFKCRVSGAGSTTIERLMIFAIFL